MSGPHDERRPRVAIVATGVIGRSWARMFRLMTDLGSTPTFDGALVERIGQQTDAMKRGASVAAIQQWRDRMVRKVVELKREDPHP